MNRDFARYLRFAGSFSVPRLEFVTNATLLREEHLQACVEARLWRLAISLDGGDAATYESIRRGASWKTLEANLNRARSFFVNAAHRPILRFIVTLVEDNFRGAPQAVRAALDWGAGEIELRETLTFPKIGLEERQLKNRGEELRSVLLECKAMCEAVGIDITILSENAPGLKIDLSGVPVCHALERRLAIAANGDAMPCMLWAREPLGNFRQMDFEQIWEGHRRQGLRQQFRMEVPRLWCPACTICKEDPADDDAYYRLLAKPKPLPPIPATGAK
jgi:radical SAM protein with 4Fe4S-binding SPASM domain